MASSSLPPDAPDAPDASDAAVAALLARLAPLVAATAERVLIAHMQGLLESQGLASLLLLSEVLTPTLRELTALLPVLLRAGAGDRDTVAAAARTLGGAAQERGVPLPALLAQGQQVHDQLLAGIAAEVRVHDRTPILAVVEVSRLIRELERHLLLAYQEQALAALTQQARTDPLTGLANRRAFDERVADEVARAQRRAQPVALVLLDVDRLKPVNDTRGHAAGDALLQAVAALLRDQARTIDLAARIGVDEFALLLPETNHAGAVTLVQRLTDAAAGQHIAGYPVRCSAGIAVYPADGRTVEALLRSADGALYRAKHAIPPDHP